MQGVQGGRVVQRLDGVRRANLAVVAHVIDRLGVASQTAIVDETGLANGAASSMLTQLREIGFVTSAEVGAPSTNSSGRPRRTVRLNPGFALAVGIEISIEAIMIQIRGADGSELATRSGAIQLTKESTPRDLAIDVFARLHSLMRSEGLPDVPVSVAVSLPGVVASDRLNVPPFGWVDQSVEEFRLVAPLRVRSLEVLNDGDAAVIAESAIRPDLDCVAALHGSDGMGGGIALKGQLFAGAGGAAGQFGHVIVEPGGRECYCGNRGCLRQYVAISAFARDLGEEEMLARIGFRGYSLKMAQRATEREAAVLTLLGKARTMVSRLVNMLGAVLSPQIIVLTGNLAPLAPWVASSPDSRMAQEEYRARWARPVVGSGLGVDSVLNGVTLEARRRVLDDPLRFTAETQ